MDEEDCFENNSIEDFDIHYEYQDEIESDKGKTSENNYNYDENEKIEEEKGIIKENIYKNFGNKNN